MALVFTLFPVAVFPYVDVKTPSWARMLEERILKKMAEWIIYTWTDPIYPLVLNWPHDAT